MMATRPISYAVLRGQVIESDLIEFGGRGGDITFLAPDPRLIASRIPLASPRLEPHHMLARIQTGNDSKGLPVVSLHPTSGQGITLTLDEVLLHSVCRLLQAAVSKSDWDIQLKLPGAEPEAAEETESRTIN